MLTNLVRVSHNYSHCFGPMTSFGITWLEVSTSFRYPEKVLFTHLIKSSFCSRKHSGPFSAMNTTNRLLVTPLIQTNLETSAFSQSLTSNLVSILMAHEVQQVLEHIHSVSLVALLVFLQTRIDGIRKSVHTLQQSVTLAAVLVENRVQITGRLSLLDLLLELVDVDQTLHAVEQILGALFGLLVGFVRAARFDALVLDGILDFVQGGNREILQICREMLPQAVHVDLVGVVGHSDC